VEKEIADLKPKRNEASNTLETLREHIESLREIVDTADDKVYRDFCRKIKVKNIRQYEEQQLKALQEGSEARTKFNTQISRLTHQSVTS
jgi:structural maintenance of chromosome 1